jgi:hypothetical protein
LLLGGGGYRKRTNGDLEYRGCRPGQAWRGHGFFSRKLTILQAGELKQVRLWKQRWWHPTKGTCHSRPPDEMGRVRVCALVYVVALFGWLAAPAGLHTHEPIFADLKGLPSTRTLQRWLRRELSDPLKTQQAYRLAVIERCEPRPVETLFVGGLSPPPWHRRPWRDPPLVASLWRAYALILGAAVKLCIPAAVLLAEARGKDSADTTSKN